MKSDGSVVAPFDVTNLPPLTLWNKGAEYYFIGISKMAITQGEFPVTISSDNSTITVGDMSTKVILTTRMQRR